MAAGFTGQALQVWEDWKAFWNREKKLRWFAAVLMALLYGIRLTQGDMFVDSDIMINRPEELMFSWYGHRRFGLILIKKLFFFVRLTPYLANALFVLTFWLAAIGICFCMYEWSGRREALRKSSFLFVLFFLSAPCFAEQFNFLLQAFEMALAICFCVFAAFCAGLRIYEKKSVLWLAPALFFMVWSFASYQAFPAFYAALVLISYIHVYLYRKECCGLREGLWQAGLFVLGFVCYMASSQAIASWQGASSSYVSAMFYWGTVPMEECLANIQMDFQRIYQAEWPTFFSRWFLYAGPLALALLLVRGFCRKSRKFPCLVLALLLLAVTPVLITLITAMPQPIRGQLTYPLVYAYSVYIVYGELAGMADGGGLLNREKACRFASGRAWKGVLALAAAAAVLIGWKQCVTMSQLWETAHETYVSDVMNAGRMYGELCRAADGEQISDCQVAFVGAQGTKLGGTPLMGDAIGHSVFQWDADSSIGVSGRAASFFEMLGMPVGMPDAESYAEAKSACADRPVWPAEGSVFLVREGLAAVKLSD